MAAVDDLNAAAARLEAATSALITAFETATANVAPDLQPTTDGLNAAAAAAEAVLQPAIPAEPAA